MADQPGVSKGVADAGTVSALREQLHHGPASAGLFLTVNSGCVLFVASGGGGYSWGGGLGFSFSENSIT